MIYAAELNSSDVVLRVVCAESVAWCSQQLGGAFWYEAWRNGGARLNFPSAGFTYSPSLDAYIPMQPYPSWSLNTTICQWEAPIPMPPGGPWEWDENQQAWVAA